MKHGKTWLLFFDFESRSVSVDKELARTAAMFRSAIVSNRTWNLTGKANREVWAACADAYADDKGAGLGGWWTETGMWPEKPEDIHWFSCQVNREDLPEHWGKVKSWQSIIATLEAVAQWVLLHLRCKESSLCKVELRQYCDNAGVVHAHGRLFSSKAPLCFALQGLAWEAARGGLALDVCHRSGVRNEYADKLSRLHDQHSAKFRKSLVESKRREVDLRSLLQMPCHDRSLPCQA